MAVEGLQLKREWHDRVALSKLNLRRPLAFIGALILVSAALDPADAACPDPKTALGVSRTVEIDGGAGGIYGSVTHLPKQPSILKPMEVVLTFDDGPMPWITHSILDTLDRFCTKATFFEVGEMALLHPAVTKDVLARGHTLGSHSMTHPFSLSRMSETAAIAEIERGFAAVQTAAGTTPLAPFFRFPGLAGSIPLMNYLHGRGIAAFTVDIVSNDSYIASKSRLVERTLAAVDRHKGGIILFHDIKAATAKGLPEILAGLKERGYSVVQLTTKEPFHPLPQVMAEIAASKETPAKHTGKAQFYATVEPDRSAATAALRGYARKKVVQRRPAKIAHARYKRHRHVYRTARYK